MSSASASVNFKGCGGRESGCACRGGGGGDRARRSAHHTRLFAALAKAPKQTHGMEDETWKRPFSNSPFFFFPFFSSSPELCAAEPTEKMSMASLGENPRGHADLCLINISIGQLIATIERASDNNNCVTPQECEKRKLCGRFKSTTMSRGLGGVRSRRRVRWCAVHK